MTTPPNAPEVDVLSVIDNEIAFAGCKRYKAVEAREKRMGQIRAAVAALLTREAALVARNAELTRIAAEHRDGRLAALEKAAELDRSCRTLVAERDALAAEVGALRSLVEEGRRAIGDHYAPNDCYATGPLTGDPIRDFVQCPACSFIAMYDKARAEAGHG